MACVADQYGTKEGRRMFMGIDQYGETYHDLVHPRKDLMERLGRKSASRMYVDTKDGVSKHIGYVIAGRWVQIYEVTQWEKRG